MADTGSGLLHLRTDDVIWREVGDEVVALRPSTGTYLALNGVGRELWRQLEAGVSEVALVEGLIERYGITRERAAGDVRTFLASLRDKDLLAEEA